MSLRGSVPPTGLTLHSSMALKLSRFQLFSLIIPYNPPTRRHHLHSTDARHMCGKGLLTCHVKFAVFAHSVGQIQNVARSFLSMKQSPLCMVLLWSGLPLLLWFLSILPYLNISYIDSQPALRAQPLSSLSLPLSSCKNQEQLSLLCGIPIGTWGTTVL